MSRRIEIELTSDRGDGSWTWRAAGAQKPRGVLDGSLLPEGAKAGDVLRAEVEEALEGITIVGVGSTQTRVRTEPERIEILGPARRDDDQLVTTQLVGRARGDRDRGDRRDRPRRDRDRDRDRPGGDRPGGEGRERRDRRDRDRDRPGGQRTERGDRRDRRDRPQGEGGERRERPPRSDRPRRPAPPPLPERPKAKRLRPGRVHRKAVLDDLPAEHQPIAEEVLRGGIPAVRQAIDAENEKRAAAGEPAINGPELLRIAEQLLPRLRTADWRDRAEAALADAEHVDLRDLRSVVVAADAAARDDETRELAATLRVKLDERVVSEQAQWVEDLRLAIDAGRIVRALRISSRPPKAGTMLDPALRTALVEGASAALSEEATPDRWAAVLDAIAYAPVRNDVAPVSIPATPSEELLAAVKKCGARVPKVAAAFGIEVSAPARPSGRSLRPPKPARRPGTVPVPPRPETPSTLAAPAPAPAPPVDAEPAAPTAPTVDEPTAEAATPAADAEAAVADQPAPEAATPAIGEPADQPAGDAAADAATPAGADPAVTGPDPVEPPSPAPADQPGAEPTGDAPAAVAPADRPAGDAAADATTPAGADPAVTEPDPVEPPSAAPADQPTAEVVTPPEATEPYEAEEPAPEIADAAVDEAAGAPPE